MFQRSALLIFVVLLGLAPAADAASLPVTFGEPLRLTTTGDRGSLPDVTSSGPGRATALYTVGRTLYAIDTGGPRTPQRLATLDDEEMVWRAKLVHGADGMRVAAWPRKGRIEVATAAPGKRFGKAVRTSVLASKSTRTLLAATAHGGIVVGTEQLRAGTGQDSVVRIAVRPSASTVFGPVQQLAADDGDADVAADRVGGALVRLGSVSDGSGSDEPVFGSIAPGATQVEHVAAIPGASPGGTVAGVRPDGSALIASGDRLWVRRPDGTVTDPVSTGAPRADNLAIASDGSAVLVGEELSSQQLMATTIDPAGNVGPTVPMGLGSFGVGMRTLAAWPGGAALLTEDSGHGDTSNPYLTVRQRTSATAPFDAPVTPFHGAATPAMGDQPGDVTLFGIAAGGLYAVRPGGADRRAPRLFVDASRDHVAVIVQADEAVSLRATARIGRRTVSVARGRRLEAFQSTGLAVPAGTPCGRPVRYTVTVTDRAGRRTRGVANALTRRCAT